MTDTLLRRINAASPAIAVANAADELIWTLVVALPENPEVAARARKLKLDAVAILKTQVRPPPEA